MEKAQGTAGKLRLEVGDLVRMTIGWCTPDVRQDVGIVIECPGKPSGETKVFVLYIDDPAQQSWIGNIASFNAEYCLFERILPAVEVARCAEQLSFGKICQLIEHIKAAQLPVGEHGVSKEVGR